MTPMYWVLLSILVLVLGITIMLKLVSSSKVLSSSLDASKKSSKNYKW